MHGQPASGARCLNFVMSVHLYPFFVCTSSEDSGQCAHVCAHMRALARVYTARTHNVRAVKTLVSVHMCVHTCAHWPESSLLVHTKNVCTCVHTSVHTCAQIFCVYKQ